MASFRKTMSTVQRECESPPVEMFHLPTSSHRLSHVQSYQQSALFGLRNFFAICSNVQTNIVRAACLKRSRASDVQQAGQSRGRAFFQFFIFFLFGTFIGLTANNLADYPVNFDPNCLIFPFKVDRPSPDAHQYRVIRRIVEVQHNVSPEEDLKQRFVNVSSDPAVLVPAASEDLNVLYRKLLIIVTATCTCPFQAYCLSRLSYTVRLVSPPLLWIVVEMAPQSAETAEMLRKTGVMYRHLVCDVSLSSIKERTAHQRNIALAHIEKHQLDGIVYFADDCHIYSMGLFEQMRTIRRFGTWPVAILVESMNTAAVEGPVCNNSQVVGWHTDVGIIEGRRFLVDLSGFAFNSSILWDHKGWHRPTLEPVRLLGRVKEGLQGSVFIEQIVEDESQMEGLAGACLKIMVWRVQQEQLHFHYMDQYLTNS